MDAWPRLKVMALEQILLEFRDKICTYFKSPSHLYNLAANRFSINISSVIKSLWTSIPLESRLKALMSGKSIQNKKHLKSLILLSWLLIFFKAAQKGNRKKENLQHISKILIVYSYYLLTIINGLRVVMAKFNHL